MKKQLIIFFVCLISIFVLNTQVTYAHFLATDGTIGAVLHVDPNDDPLAGEQASFFFAFKDKDNKFQPQNCDCIFEIDEDGKSIYTQPLFQNTATPSFSNASIFYTFPKKDVYAVKVIGKPVSPNDFQPFTLSWNFRVDQEAIANNTNNNFPIVLATTFGIGIVFIGLVIVMILKKTKRKHRKGGDREHEKYNNTIY